MPPPVHGVSVICEQLYSSILNNLSIKKKLVELNLSQSIAELQHFSLRKIIRFFIIGIKLLYQIIFFRPDLVYFSIMPVGKGFIKDFFFVVLLKTFRLKIVYHLHNKGIPGYYNHRIFKSLYKFTFKNCSIIHLSEELAKKELANLPLTNVELFVVPNGISPLEKHTLKEDNNKLSILFFSNLIPEKGYLVSLKSILKLIEKNHKDIRLIIAGNPTRKASKVIMDFLKANPILLNYVEIKGAVFNSDKASLFNETDLFIFPSRFTQECMPLVILEAMSIGLPVIASDIGAIPNLVTDNKNGFLIPPGNEDRLTEKIEFFIDNQEQIQRFGNESLKIFHKKFTRNQFIHNMEKVFIDILQIT